MHNMQLPLPHQTPLATQAHVPFLQHIGGLYDIAVKIVFVACMTLLSKLYMRVV